MHWKQTTADSEIHIKCRQALKQGLVDQVVDAIDNAQQVTVKNWMFALLSRWTAVKMSLHGDMKDK